MNLRYSVIPVLLIVATIVLIAIVAFPRYSPASDKQSGGDMAQDPSRTASSQVKK